MHCGAIGSFGWLSFWCLVNVVFVVVRLWFRLFVVVIVFCLFVLVTGVWLVFDSVVCVICGLGYVIDLLVLVVVLIELLQCCAVWPFIV